MVVIGIVRDTWVRVELIRGKSALRILHVDRGQESACSEEKGGSPVSLEIFFREFFLREGSR